MPLPISVPREWDEGNYDGWLYDGHTKGQLSPKPATGGVIRPLGDQRPAVRGTGVQKK